MNRITRLGALSAVVVGLTIGAGSQARAKDGEAGALSRKELDGRIDALLLEVIDAGVRLYNDQRDYAGCYRLYQGSLMSVRPLLDHRPELRGVVERGLKQAETQRSASDRAFALREVIDTVRKEISKPSPPTARSLWDRLGGEAAVKAVVHDFVVAAASDPKVNFDRNGTFQFNKEAVAALESHLVDLVSAVSGGPRKYSGRDMKTAHKGMAITGAEFNALAGHLVATLKKYRVPQKEIDELVTIVAGTRKDIVEKE